MRKSNMKVWHRVALALACSLAACKPAPAPVEDVRPVRTLTLGATPVQATLVYAGEVRARYESPLAFRVGGKLVSRAVSVGDRVRAGQVLARLDPEDLRLGDVAASAQVSAAEAQFLVAKNDLKRVRDLHAKGYASQGELDRFNTQYEAAKAQLAAISAQRDQVANQARYAVLLADATGVVTAALAEPEQVVAAGQPVLQLAREGALEVASAIPEDQINRVRVGMPVQVSLWAEGDKRYAGEIRELSSAADPLTRTYAVRVSMPDTAPEMKLRMTASIAIPLEDLPSLLHVPAPSMVTQDGKAGVWIVNTEDDVVHFRPLEFAGVEGNAVLVASGLAAGDVVVTAGAGFLREGQKVKILGTPPVAAKPAAAP